MHRSRVSPSELVWYVSYGSNLCAARLSCYLAGGQPAGAARCYSGCRDPSPAQQSLPVWLPGGVYFALESTVWTGGVAFYDPDLSGTVAARGYLVTAGQFWDIVAQEMHRPLARTPPPLTAVLSEGRASVGPGHYETLMCAGWLDGAPLLTFTAPWSMAQVQTRAPSAAYLSMLSAGLREAHGWSRREAAAYLAALPGAAGSWMTDAIAALPDPTTSNATSQNG